MDRFKEPTRAEGEREERLVQIREEYKEKFDSIRCDIKIMGTSATYGEFEDIQFIIGELEDYIEQLKELNKNYDREVEQL